MPNHVKTIVHLCGPLEDVRALRKAIATPSLSEPGYPCLIDFNKVIPTPADIFQGNLGNEEREKYGTKNWYDWNTEHWGTKWNAYSQVHENERLFVFQTAWSYAEPVMAALAEMFPTVTIKIRYADEDIGSNCGKLVYCGGKFATGVDKDGDVEFARRVWSSYRAGK